MKTPKSLRIAIFSLLMVMSAAAANAVMDTLSFRYDRSVFANFTESRDWLDPQVSWKNKWKNGDPKQGEAFILSSTALVATTDAWHLSKAATIFFILLAILAPFTLLFELPWFGWLGALFGLKLIYGLIFEGLFANLLI